MIPKDVAKKITPMFARRAAKRVHSETRWIRNEFIHSPRFAIFCRQLSKKNAAFFHKVTADTQRNQDDWLSNGHPKDIPRKLWMYWHSGEEEAPEIVRLCFQSWRRLNPKWDLTVLNKSTAHQIVDMSDIDPELPHRTFADVLRLRLLDRFGGVWTDATTYCHQPLDNWLLLWASTGFFAFSDPGPDRWLDNWFIASEPGGRLVQAWESVLVKELGKIGEQPRAYFTTMYSFEWAVRRDPSLLALWKGCWHIPAAPSFLLASALNGRTSSNIVERALSNGWPISKLSFKQDLSASSVQRFLSAI